MAAPTFISEAEVSAWNTTTSPKATASFNIQSGDVLVAFAMNEQGTTGVARLGISTTGATLTWSLQQTVQNSAYCEIAVWTATAGSTASGVTVNFSNSAGNKFGGNVLVFRGSSGISTTAKDNQDDSANANGATNKAEVSITTTGANSAIVWACGDYSATDGRSGTYNTSGGAGAFTLQTNAWDSTAYMVYGGYHADAGSAGSKTVGVATPAQLVWALVAVEVLGSGSTQSQAPRSMHQFRQRLAS